MVLEGEVYAEVDCGVAVEGHSLFCCVAECAVHSEEHVEACGVDAEQPSESYAVSGGHGIDACRECFARRYVGRQAEVGPGEFSGKACGVEQSEFEAAVYGESVFCADIHCC